MRQKAYFMAFFFTLGITVVQAAEDDEIYWFKEEIACDPYKIKVRSYCYDDDKEGGRGNHYCPEQEIIINHPNGQSYKKSLTFQKYWKDKLTAHSLLCVKNQSGKVFILISYANGGNCDSCESVDVMNDQGKWLTKHGKNLGLAAQRTGIRLSPWPGSSFIDFTNTVRDEGNGK